MNKDKKNKPDGKKPFPGGFLIFLMAALLLFLTFQNFSTDKRAPVSFSHQAEHLVNLDLINGDMSKKTALNDHLVTFSGRFKEQLSDEAKARYRYLELVDEKHSMEGAQNRLAKDLSALQKEVRTSGEWFLEISGLPIPKEGYRVIDTNYDTATRKSSVIIKEIMTPRDLVSLTSAQQLYKQMANNPNNQGIDQLGRQLQSLVQNFRAPILGIGSESIKQQLREIESDLDKTSSASGMTNAQKLGAYNTAILSLNQIVSDLNGETNSVRLIQLRSVRNYMENLEQYQLITRQLKDNEAKLNRARESVANVIWFFNNKEVSSRALEQENPEAFSHWFASAKKEWQGFAANRGASFKAPDQPRNQVLEKTFKSEEPAPNYFSYLLTLLPVLLVIVLLYFVFSRQMKGMGSTAMNFGKSPARMLHRSQNKITFKDVAGIEEAKEELVEIVDFLRDPNKFTALGARIPKGVLCIGPPGTGKTLIAKAVAGEANRPFFSISGSDFVEMFVGVGASRIRDLFKEAKTNSPCIIFIDEIDAVGRHRGAGIGGGHDEREQTLNQLLVEMDGFDTNEGVILMAATNRPDVLDKALLRPGRFDRRITLDLPDVKGRFEILKVHAKRIKLDSSVDLMNIARATPGASGADLMNILNEAALLSARKNRSAVTMTDAMEACDKVRFGKERKSIELDHQEKLTTAYHESGHAVVGLVVEHADPVEKVTIIPRGFSLGATHFIPKKNRFSYWRKELLDQLAVLMGGRVAEELFVKDVSSGARMDFSQATKLARSMVCEWGMSDVLGAVSYGEDNDPAQYHMPNYHEKSYSEETALAIDKEVKKIIDEAYHRAKKILEEKREAVELMTQMLMEFETLDKEDVKEIIEDRFNIENKRKRLKDDLELKKNPSPPPLPDQPKQSDAEPSPGFS